MKIEVAALTDRGLVREINEDSFFADELNYRFFMVADGLGGHLAGEEASRLAIEEVKKVFEVNPVRERSSLTVYADPVRCLLSNGADDGIKPPSALKDFIPPTKSVAFSNGDHHLIVFDELKKAISQANQAICEESSRHPELAEMGTTIVVAFWQSPFLSLAHVGDSRAYLIRQKEIRQLTNDHSVVNEFVKSGEISKELARFHPARNVLSRALGTSRQVEIDFNSLELINNDYILLCTDGLTEALSDEEILKVILEKEKPGQICPSLVAMVNKRGGHDNTTLIIFQIKEV